MPEGRTMHTETPEHDPRPRSDLDRSMDELMGSINGQPANFAAAAHQPNDTRRRVCVIDVGSNSVRFYAVEGQPELPEEWEILAEGRENTRLGATCAVDGRLDPATMQRTVDAIVEFQRRAESLAAPIGRAVATAAVRSAENRDQFVEMVHAATGLTLDVISSAEEGHLGFRGAMLEHTAELHGLRRPAAVIDAGGGSLQVIVGVRAVPIQCVSLPLGAVHLTYSHGGPEAVLGGSFDALRKHVRKVVRRALEDLAVNPRVLYGIGGASTAAWGVAQIAAAEIFVDDDAQAAAFDPARGLDSEDLKRLVNGLRRLNLAQIAALTGMSAERSEIAVAGLVAIREVVATLDCGPLRVGQFGLREGLALEAMEAQREHDIIDAALGLGLRCDFEAAHARQVARLALEIHDQLEAAGDWASGTHVDPGQTLSAEGAPAIRRSERELLEVAAILHDVGILLGFRRHHRTSQRIIAMNGIHGLTAEEVAVVAAVARYHRRRGPKLSQRAFARLSAQQRGIVRRLAGILRVADGLDRTHTAAVEHVTVRVGPEIELLVTPTAGAAAEEIAAAVAKSDVLEYAAGRPIKIHSDQDQPRSEDDHPAAPSPAPLPDERD